MHYPEMSYAYTNNEMGLHLVEDEKNIVNHIMYGDQLTQIPFDEKHPYFDKIAGGLINCIRDGDHGEFSVLLTGYNISMKDPYVLKNLIELSDDHSVLCNFAPYGTVENSLFDHIRVYRKIGFDETADFVKDIWRFVEMNDTAYALKNLNEILPGNKNVIREYEQKYIQNVGK